MITVPKIKFRDGRSIPQLGFGIWQIPDDEATRAVSAAFKAGYRAVDSAAIYRNEAGLGKAIKESGLRREDLYITTKLWNDDQGFESTLKAFDTSMKKLGLEELDLYLIHWPSPKRNAYVESWKALIQLQKDRRVKSIGVSNFSAPHLDMIIKETGVVPVLNQVELHPHFQQRELRAVHAKHGIVTECWSPLGQGKIFDDDVLKSVGHKHGKSTAQVILRWHLQHGFVVIPKSVTPNRIQENFDVFGFTLDAAEMKAIDGLDSATGRIGPVPDTADF